MSGINCSVNSCYYNESQICSAQVLNIGGRGSHFTESTCCETYQNRESYDNLVTDKIERGGTKEILCKVNTCAYHARNRCTLEAIEVGSLTEVRDYTETDCLSFERE